MVAIKSLALLSVLGLLAQAEDVFWVVRHGKLITTRLDPIINPNAVSSHVHAIIGSNSFSPEYTYENSRAGTCTTANVNVDMSNYWMPSLYRKQGDGTFKHAGLSYANTYYQLRRGKDEPVYEFPPGFRMMAGDANRRTLDVSDPAQDAIRYVCLGGNTPEGHEFPKEKCPMGLRAQAYFPHCWDGVNNWLEGNKHVAYGEGKYDGGGKCPDTHPKRIMSIFYEFIFHDDFDYQDGARVLANGDDLGYSLHADFTNGWPEGTFKEIFSYGTQCNVGFTLENCPALKPLMKGTSDCQYDGVIVDEDIGNSGIAKLPGNNPVWGRSGPKVPDANYVETAQFTHANNNGSSFKPSGSGKPYAQVGAGNLHVITVRNDPAFTGVTSVAQIGATNSAGGGGAAEPTSAAPVVSASASFSASSSRASVSSASRQTSAAAVSATVGSASQSLTTVTRTSTRTAVPTSSSKSTIGGNLVATPSSTPAAGASDAETASIPSVSASSSVSVKPSQAEAGSPPSSTTKPHVGKCNRRRSLNDRKIRKVRSQRD